MMNGDCWSLLWFQSVIGDHQMKLFNAWLKTNEDFFFPNFFFFGRRFFMKNIFLQKKILFFCKEKSPFSRDVWKFYEKLNQIDKYVFVPSINKLHQDKHHFENVLFLKCDGKNPEKWVRHRCDGAKIDHPTLETHSDNFCWQLFHMPLLLWFFECFGSPMLYSKHEPVLSYWLARVCLPLHLDWKMFANFENWRHKMPFVDKLWTANTCPASFRLCNWRCRWF